MEISRVGSFVLGWGESLVWDEREQRLYFVDCAAQTLHWLEEGSESLHTLQLPSMAAGIVPTEDGRLVAALHDGLYVVDPDRGRTELLSPYPAELGGRGNDMCADLAGNLITGKLNLQPDEGSTWWFSAEHGWRLIDPAISNTNGPAVGTIGGTMTLIVGDTAADYYRYDYSPENGTVGERSVFGDVSELAGHPDGTTLDAGGGLWCALFGGSQLVRFTADGFDTSISVPVDNPTDVTFGGPDLDRLFVVSVAGPADAEFPTIDGALLVIDGLPTPGRPEPRLLLPPATPAQ